MKSGGSIVCPACGAGVSKAAKACAYCGAEVVLPMPKGVEGPADRRTFCTRCGTMYPSGAGRCGRCPPGADGEPGTRCPRCGDALEITALGGCRVDRCGKCRGHWFDGDEIEHTIDVTTKGIGRHDAQSLRRTLPPWKGGVEAVRYVACVRCGELMARRQLAPRAGVIVDVCRNHGVWFDGGEFEHFAAFVRAGGLEVLRHDEVASAEAKRKSASAAIPVDVPRRDDGHPTIEGAIGGAVLRGLRELFRWRP